MKPLLILLLIGGLLMIPQRTDPRGIRNHNPGNIRYTGDEWRGMVSQDEGGFVVFESPVYGIRAMARILNNYRERGLDSVREIISAWAPPSENNTGAYVEHVASALGVNPDAPLSPQRYASLIAVMIRHENGKQPYSASLIQEGVALA